MAGISIRLEKLLNQKNYISNFFGYFITTFAVAGPWIVTIVVLTVFSALYSQEIRVSVDYQLFNATIVYGFIGSQLITVPFQFVVTRYLADEIYRERKSFIRPTFIGISKLVMAISAIIGLIIYIRGGLPFVYVVFSTYFFTMTSLVWVSSFFLSAINEHFYLGKSFIIGSTTGVVIMLIVNALYRFETYPVTMSGVIMMLSVMTTIFLLNTTKILKNVEEANDCQFDFIRGFSDHKTLFFIGLFYVFGLWIDKFIMWGSDLGTNVLGFLYICPPYDQSAFLSSLFIIPGNVLFLTVVEVYFIRYYKLFYDSTRKGTLKDIKSAKMEMRTRLFTNIFKIILIQTIFIMFAYIFADAIFSLIGYDVVSKKIFINLLVGNVFFVMIIIFMTLFLYFEEKLKALLLLILFFVLNVVFTISVMNMDYSIYGIGFTGAVIIAYVVALILLVITINDTDYKLFGVNSIIYRKKKGFFAKMADKGRIRNGVEVDE